MKKGKYFLPFVLLALILGLNSCFDDATESSVDWEWKNLNEGAFDELPVYADANGVVLNDTGYITLQSQSGNGRVRWRLSTIITDSDIPKSLTLSRITAQQTPESTDSVVVRYEGWYISKEGKKIIFDSTENPSVSKPNGVNKKSITILVSGVVDGFTTILQDMKAGDEREVWIPWQLGYGTSGNSSIPGFTTLRFRIKLEKIIQMPSRTE